MIRVVTDVVLRRQEPGVAFLHRPMVRFERVRVFVLFVPVWVHFKQLEVQR